MKRKHEICAMQILLIAATKEEIQPFINVNPQIDVLIAGVGVPATIYHLQKRMQQIDYDLIIQAGIAGAYKQELTLGETVLINQDTFGDLGMEEKEDFTSIFETALAGKDEFPFTNGWLMNTNKIFKKSSLPVVKAITINKISDSILQKQQLIKQFDADIETMEGAALHYVCLQENILFLQMRSVSNYVGERDKTKWKMKEAIDKLNTELLNLINQLTD
jgi:futalosine hydrolase